MGVRSWDLKINDWILEGKGWGWKAGIWVQGLGMGFVAGIGLGVGVRVGSQRCDQNQIWVGTGLGSAPDPGYWTALGSLGPTGGAKSGAKDQDLGARSGGQRSQAAGPVQRHPAQPGAAVDGAGDVEGAVGDAEEAVLHPVGVVELAEVGRRVLAAELCGGR